MKFENLNDSEIYWNVTPPVVESRDESKYSLGIPCVARVSAKSMSTIDGRQIDRRECAPSDDVDWNWGEQDSLDNIPRKKVPTWIKALSDDGQHGDE